MHDALALVKRELGPDAVILGTRHVAGTLTRRARVEITAANPDGGAPSALRPPGPSGESPAPRGGASAPLRSALPADPAEFGPALHECFVRLVQNEVAEEIALELVRTAQARLRGSADPVAVLRAVVRDWVQRLVPDAPVLPAGHVAVTVTDAAAAGPGADPAPSSPPRPAAPRKLAVVGPSGSGKTTTIAKLAAHYKLRRGARVALLSLDSQRLDAGEQLRRYGAALAIPVYQAQSVGEARDALRACGDVDLVLIDTFGVGVRDQGRFARLACLLRGARPDETQLVLPASLAPAVQQRVAESLAPFGPAGLVLTRLDDLVGFGVVLNVMQRLNLGVSYVSTGPGVPQDIRPTPPEALAELLVPAAP